MDALTKAVLAVKLKAKYPDLIQVPEGNYAASLTTAAKNARIELKKAFPGVKFSVKTERYSGGDSMRAYWIDGPTTQQVEAIIDKYSAGSFDGMQDLYTYSDDAFTDIFGDAKYVFANRSFSDAMIAKVIAQVAADFGGCEPFTVADYRAGRAYYWKQSGGCDMERQLNIALSQATEFPEEMEAAA